MNENNLQENKNSNINWWLISLAIVIGFWLVAMGIVVAGWLISKEMAKKEIGTNPYAQVSNKIDFATDDQMPSLGDANSKVNFVLFADFQCPYCKQFHDEVYPQLKKEFIDTNKIKFTFADFAFLGEESKQAASASRCALEQNKYWEYFDYLYNHQAGENEGGFSDENLKTFAEVLGLDKTKFNSCIDSAKYKTTIENLTKSASDAGVSSTPTILINGLKFEGVLPYENLKQIILSELSK